MNKLLVVLVVVAMACMKDKAREAVNVSGVLDVNEIASDTGTIWRVDRLVYKYARLGSIDTLYLPDYTTSVLGFSSQRISFKKQSLYSGFFGVTDTLSQLMNIPKNGKYYVEVSDNQTVLKLRLDGGSNYWLGFKRALGANLIAGWRNYQLHDTDYHVEYRLVDLKAPS